MMRTQPLVWWAVALGLLPLALFSWWTVLATGRHQDLLVPVQGLQAWHEPLGTVVFNHASLSQLVRTPPDVAAMRWADVQLPYFRELGASVDMPPDAPKYRVWLKIPIPASPDNTGRQALLGFRVQGGPWALWFNGQLLQANLADWRMQWNVPVRVTVPLGATEVWLAVPYAEPQGFSIGSIFVGPADAVESAWRERNLWHLELPRIMTGVSFLLMFISFHLAWLRPREPLFVLLGCSALAWSLSCFQFAFDITGNDTLSLWFGSAVDSAITWMVVLAVLFSFELERVRLPRFELALLAYALASTVVTLPLWEWQKNALIAQQYGNVIALAVSIVVLTWHVVRHPRREGMVLILTFAAKLILGLHTLNNLTNQTNPDSFYSFAAGTALMYLAFTYVMSRRTVSALQIAEQHESNLLQQLDLQAIRLREQHKRLQELEVHQQLSLQHDRIMQDLHDRLGSNLTSALLQARSGGLSPNETVLMLQDLANELRFMGKSGLNDHRGLNEVLAELRQRVQHRLRHGGIELVWDVDPDLPATPSRDAAQHIHAMLSEAIANAIKHSGATRITLSASSEASGAVLLELTDNGRGFDPTQVASGRGLPGLQQRAAAIAGQVSIASESGKGTKIKIVFEV
jgi:signal transduction histidine kinase